MKVKLVLIITEQGSLGEIERITEGERENDGGNNRENDRQMMEFEDKGNDDFKRRVMRM